MTNIDEKAVMANEVNRKTLDQREVVIDIKNIKKTFYVKENRNDSIRDSIFNMFNQGRTKKIEALKGVDLQVRKGEFLGIIGRNGSGKSTLLKIITGAMPPDKGGAIDVKGRMIRLALGMGFDPNLSARENIYVNASILGLTFRQIGEKFHEIIAFAELEDFVDTQVRFFSSGMRSRLAFAIAVHADADIFLMDEFFGGVGDVGFKKKSEAVFKESFLQGRTIIHVSHSLSTVQKHCDRVLLLNRGEMVGIGEPKEMIEKYKKLF